MSLAQEFALTFVPILVAIDALGTLTVLLPLSHGMGRREWWRMVNIAVLTASVVGLAFLFVGRWVLGMLGIEVAHFAIAGGLVLLMLAVRDLVAGQIVDAPRKEEMVAVVPIGTPLTAGPATLTALMLLSDQFGLVLVLAAFMLNMAVAWGIFQGGDYIFRFLGHGGLRAVSKVASLLLAAIAVKMVFRGVELLFGIGG